MESCDSPVELNVEKARCQGPGCGPSPQCPRAGTGSSVTQGQGSAERLSISHSTQEDFLEEEGRAVQFFYASSLAEGGSSLGSGFLVLAGAADTVNPTPAHEGK